LRDKHIHDAFRQCQERIQILSDTGKVDCMFSGTTVVTLLMQNDTLVCANAGDSRAILCSCNQAGIWNFTALSRDHKPDEPDEAARVKKCNGRIEQSRLVNSVGGGLP
jgi:serine/threonine protein phosphatase PrpC